MAARTKLVICASVTVSAVNGAVSCAIAGVPERLLVPIRAAVKPAVRMDLNVIGLPPVNCGAMLRPALASDMGYSPALCKCRHAEESKYAIIRWHYHYFARRHDPNSRRFLMSVTIRPIEPRDEAAWRALWKAYLEFYETTVPEEVYSTTFARLLSADHPD